MTSISRKVTEINNQINILCELIECSVAVPINLLLYLQKLNMGGGEDLDVDAADDDDGEFPSWMHLAFFIQLSNS